MAIRVRTVRSNDELVTAMSSIGHYFGWVPTAEQVESIRSYLPLDRMHAAFEDGRIVGRAGVYPFELTVPAGPLRCAGGTIAGVTPTHRRRAVPRRRRTPHPPALREARAPVRALPPSDDT